MSDVWCIILWKVYGIVNFNIIRLNDFYVFIIDYNVKLKLNFLDKWGWVGWNGCLLLKYVNYYVLFFFELLEKVV